MIPATLAAPSFSATAGKSSFSPGSSGRPTATWAGILRPANSISSTSMRSGSTAFAASRQTCNAWAVVLPARGLQATAMIFNFRGSWSPCARLVLAAVTATVVAATAAPALRNRRRDKFRAMMGLPVVGPSRRMGPVAVEIPKSRPAARTYRDNKPQLPRPRPAAGTHGSSVRPLTSTASECQQHWPPCRRSSLHHRSPGPASSLRRIR